MTVSNFSILLATLVLMPSVPARGSLLLGNITVASSSLNCYPQTAGMAGTLGLSAFGIELDFGAPETFGTTEPCGARLGGGGGQPYGDGGLITGEVFHYQGGICELQDGTDVCSGFLFPAEKRDRIDFEFLTATTAIITDVPHGGNFEVTLNIPADALPEPTTFLFVVSGAGLIGLSLARRRR